jgi:hypothetical protein
VPTFDIADLAKAGAGGGVSFSYGVAENLYLMAEADLGFHGGADIDSLNTSYVDVDVSHYMGKLGYKVYEAPDGKLKILINAGAGMMSFKPDAEGADTFNYLAINVGGKLYYLFSEKVGLVVSPQGDIGFTDEDDGFTGSTAWVWPFSAGIFINL